MGECFEILETSERVYIGTDFPDEYAHSKDTKDVKGVNEKENAYEMLSETIANRIEGAWINLNEVAICACGGTSQKLTLGYEVIDDPQMATSKGLYLVAKKKFSA